MELHIFFHEQTGENANIPEIKKIQCVSEQQLYIKRDVGGTEEIADYDLSALRTGESWKAARTENLYSYAYLIDEKGFVKIAAGVPAGQAVPKPIHKIIVPPGYPYLADGETETSETPDTTPTGLPTATSDDDLKKEIRAAAVKHARHCTDLMNANWALNNEGQFQSDLDRWRNTRLWIISGLAVIDAILDSTEALWSVDVAEDALKAYKSLIPADKKSIETWYFAHNPTIWAAYFGTTSPAPAYFKWTRGANTPAFASDAATSTQWIEDTTNNDTLAVTFSVSSTPEDFSSE